MDKKRNDSSGSSEIVPREQDDLGNISKLMFSGIGSSLTLFLCFKFIHQ